jgi:hypothetical protein
MRLALLFVLEFFFLFSYDSLRTYSARFQLVRLIDRRY